MGSDNTSTMNQHDTDAMDALAQIERLDTNADWSELPESVQREMDEMSQHLSEAINQLHS